MSSRTLLDSCPRQIANLCRNTPRARSLPRSTTCTAIPFSRPLLQQISSFPSRHLTFPSRPSISQCRRFSQSARSRSSTSDSAAATSVQAPDYLDEGERKIFDMVQKSLSPTRLEVQDVSGGCGSMYALDIVAEQFRGLSTIKQHRLVNSILGEEIKKWHGVQLKTKAP